LSLQLQGTRDEFLTQQEEYLPEINYRTPLVIQLKKLCKQRGLAVHALVGLKYWYVRTSTTDDFALKQV
jgi:hypothetical protein